MVGVERWKGGGGLRRYADIMNFSCVPLQAFYALVARTDIEMDARAFYGIIIIHLHYLYFKPILFGVM